MSNLDKKLNLTVFEYYILYSETLNNEYIERIHQMPYSSLYL